MTLDIDLYSKIQILALKVSAKKQTNINYYIVFWPKYGHSILKNTLKQELKKVFQIICLTMAMSCYK